MSKKSMLPNSYLLTAAKTAEPKLTSPKQPTPKKDVIPNRKELRKKGIGTKQFTGYSSTHARLVSGRRLTPASFHTHVVVKTTKNGKPVTMRIPRENWGGVQDAK
jgi:hypothetical protein